MENQKTLFGEPENKDVGISLTRTKDNKRIKAYTSQLIGHIRGTSGRKIFPIRQDAKEISGIFKQKTKELNPIYDQEGARTAEAYRIYDKNGLSPCVKNTVNILDSSEVISPCLTQAVGRKGCSQEEMSQVNAIAKAQMIGTIPMTATKRTFETPKEINQFLKNNKGNLNISQIANYLNLPKTQVEHYFRTDESRAIPSPDIWIRLKELLNFNDSFDKLVTETYQKEIEFEQTRRVYNSDGLSPTLNTIKQPIIYHQHSSTEIREFENSPTLCNRMGTGGNNVPMVMNLQPRQGKGIGGKGTIGKENETYALDTSCGQGGSNNLKLRRLTPIECERLQGFPDNWTAEGIDEKGNLVKISNTQRYKMCGNAVTTSVIYAIAKKLTNKNE